jgi:hypothetical protein
VPPNTHAGVQSTANLCVIGSAISSHMAVTPGFPLLALRLRHATRNDGRICAPNAIS